MACQECIRVLEIINRGEASTSAVLVPNARHQDWRFEPIDPCRCTAVFITEAGDPRQVWFAHELLLRGKPSLEKRIRSIVESL